MLDPEREHWPNRRARIATIRELAEEIEPF
jgi:hypothetical protein